MRNYLEKSQWLFSFLMCCIAHQFRVMIASNFFKFRTASPIWSPLGCWPLDRRASPAPVSWRCNSSAIRRLSSAATRTFFVMTARASLSVLRFMSSATQLTEPVFVNLSRSPEIDSQPCGPVQQPYLLYRPARLQRLEVSIPRNRFLGSLKVYKYGLWYCSQHQKHYVTLCVTSRFCYTLICVRPPPTHTLMI